MYKDKDKQREANRERQRRYKDRQKALLSEGVTDKALPDIGYQRNYEITAHTKRGLDIKCFEDLPPDVQDTIVKMSTIDGKVDNAEWNKRIAAAIHYQHVFPDRYMNKGIDNVRTGGRAGSEST